ncbi:MULTISPECIES: hypothetical protein [Streptomyces]|uniref:hypothetical protein n=1 Tax=Streptomyces TaxID=1883 RepID=UPI001291990E|nr:MULTISPECIES: hypothetical protein [Streptomyces]MCX5035646.1 hypothetical protein [Streptomyces coelicoflavus]QFX81940.1 hypothetical protein GEV49_14075 [Streptomyces sp. SYP-A7193]
MIRRRPALLAALTLTAAAALTLSACGSSVDSSGQRGDKTARAGTDSDPSTSPTVSVPVEVDRPEITLPADVTYKFEWGRTGDPVKDAVLHDAEQRIRAVDMAIAEQDPLHKAYRFYSEGEAAAGSEQYIQDFVDHKARTTGLTRYYGESVNVEDDGTAALVYCEDQSKSFNKFIQTGKTEVTPATKDSYVVYAGELRKNSEGVWVTERLVSERGSTKCRP